MTDPIPSYIQWVENNIYKVGDVVQFGDTIFQCIQNHESAITIIPANMPGFWALLKKLEA
jgi:predicted phage tail protein